MRDTITLVDIDGAWIEIAFFKSHFVKIAIDKTTPMKFDAKERCADEQAVFESAVRKGYLIDGRLRQTDVFKRTRFQLF